MTSGLRISGTNGPKTGLLRVAKNSSAAFFCASVYFSEGIAGMRSWEMAFPEIEQTNTAQQMLLIIMIPPRADVRFFASTSLPDFWFASQKKLYWGNGLSALFDAVVGPKQTGGSTPPRSPGIRHCTQFSHCRPRFESEGEPSRFLQREVGRRENIGVARRKQEIDLR